MALWNVCLCREKTIKATIQRNSHNQNMTFTTITFFLFLLLVFTVHWRMKTRLGQNLTLLISSYLFYSWWDYRFCVLMLVSSVVDYCVGRLLAGSTNVHRRKCLLLVSIITNIGFLGFFKYCNFFIENLASLTNAMGLEVNLRTLSIILPVGISFYTFQTLAYTIDIYRNKIKPERSIIDYLTFISFFPQLVAGPIERSKNLLPQFKVPREFSYDQGKLGSKMILWGAFKKMVIADNLAIVVDRTYGSVSDCSGGLLVLATVFFAFQIYCDFSGYSDIAIGTAKLFRINLMQNFNFPYFSKNISEFWRRWHISLSTWFRDYVYIPLGGSHKGKFRQCVNVLATFMISGFWHGASWNFVLWGLVNGVAVIPVILLEGKKRRTNPAMPPGEEGIFPSLSYVFKVAVTMSIICFSWIFFRAADISESFAIISRIAGGIADWKSISIFGHTLAGQSKYISLCVLLIAAEWLTRSQNNPFLCLKVPRIVRLAMYSAIVWIIVVFGAISSGQFIYFQF